jgi:cytochrome P450
LLFETAPGPPCGVAHAAANAAIQSSMDHVAGLYAKRRQEPRDDLLTHLVQAKDVDGELSHGELITLFSTIFGSGASTTSVVASGLAKAWSVCTGDQASRLDPMPES